MPNQLEPYQAILEIDHKVHIKIKNLTKKAVSGKVLVGFDKALRDDPKPVKFDEKEDTTKHAADEFEVQVTPPHDWLEFPGSRQIDVFIETTAGENSYHDLSVSLEKGFHPLERK
jgi:hypothetical protein